jgi:lysophospholipase L1-like esterase
MRIGFTTKARVVAALFAAAIAHAQSSNGNDPGEHWVSTWATAQQLVASGRPGAPGNLPAKFADQTVRMIVRVSLGGNRVRVLLSNMLNAQPLEIGAAHTGLHAGGGAITNGTDRVLTFGGSSAFTIPPGVLAVSDPVDLGVAPLSELAISIYFPSDTRTPTSHMLGLRTTYISKGDATASASMPDPTTMFSYVWLAGIDVPAPADAFTVVALGDSITDGYATTRDADQAWPTLLAKRLNVNKATQHVAVVNQGISGNQVLRDGAGISALARLERDVLSRSGVKWIILLEGINDINIRGRMEGPNALTSDELIWGYRQIIARCHAQGIQVIGATIMPEEGVPTASERGEQIRQTVNRWIRAMGSFDAVVDFDAVVRDPQRPIRLKQQFDPGDHIHPNDVGNQAMADAFELDVFKR